MELKNKITGKESSALKVPVTCPVFEPLLGKGTRVFLLTSLVLLFLAQFKTVIKNELTHTQKQCTWIQLKQMVSF